MKYIFEENDVKAGTYFLRRGIKNITYLEKVGFVDIETEQKYCLISMTDGFVVKFDNKKTLAKYLNEERYTPITLYDVINLIRETL